MNVTPHGLHVGDAMPGGQTFAPGTVALSFAPETGSKLTIKPHTYSGIDSLQSVHIPANTRVKADAFKNCKNLEQVHIADPATTIVSTEAFAGCPKIRQKPLVRPSKAQPSPRQPRSAGGEALAQAFS